MGERKERSGWETEKEVGEKRGSEKKASGKGKARGWTVGERKKEIKKEKISANEKTRGSGLATF